MARWFWMGGAFALILAAAAFTLGDAAMYPIVIVSKVDMEKPQGAAWTFRVAPSDAKLRVLVKWPDSLKCDVLRQEFANSTLGRALRLQPDTRPVIYKIARSTILDGAPAYELEADPDVDPTAWVIHQIHQSMEDVR